MADDRLELHKALRDASEKYTYFLLAASGAAIAFAITQSQTATLSASKIPLGIAVLCWGLSFMSGCWQLHEAGSITYQNYEYLRIKDGMHPVIPADPQFVNEIAQRIEQNATKSGEAGKWQFRFLIAGALFYIAWHVTEMYIRTPH